MWGFDVWCSVRAYDMALSSNSLLLLCSDHHESYIVYYLYLYLCYTEDLLWIKHSRFMEGLLMCCDVSFFCELHDSGRF